MLSRHFRGIFCFGLHFVCGWQVLFDTPFIQPGSRVLPPFILESFAVRRKHAVQRARAYQDLVHTLAPGEGCVTLSFIMMSTVCVRAGVLPCL
jgi:hypothetical protein